MHQLSNMAPRKRNHTQLSMLHFTKRNAVVPNTAEPPKRVNGPLRPVPRPTAPPFFDAPMPTAAAPRHSLSIADDAWEVADRLVRGERLTPRKRVFEDHAPVVEESDDDFEPHTLTQPNSRRPGFPKSTTPLRDDRASMTKRSANKSNRSEPLGVIPTQHRSQLEDLGLPPKMPSLSSSEDDDDNHVVVFDGEKSSLSGTDSEDERLDEIDLDIDLVDPSPQMKRNGNSLPADERESLSGSEEKNRYGDDEADIDDAMDDRPRTQNNISQPSNTRENGSSLKAPMRGRSSQLLKRNISLSVPESPTQPSKQKMIFEASPRTPSSRGMVPKPKRTVGHRKCSRGADDMFEDQLPKESQPQRKKIRPLFNSDTDDSDLEERVCQERRRRGRLKSPEIPSPLSPSLDESLEADPPSRPIVRDKGRGAREDCIEKESKGSSLREVSQEAESSDVEIVLTPEQKRNHEETKSGSSKRARRNARRRRISLSSDEEPEDSMQAGCNESPPRTPRIRKNNTYGTDSRRKSISDYIATASPSLSPPSTVKKRGRLRRLPVTKSSEDEQDVHAAKNDSALRKACQSIATRTASLRPSGTPKSAEWYQERDIDEFTESSSDTKLTPRRSYVKRRRKRAARAIASGSPATRRPLPVKRDISKNFDQSDQSPDQYKPAGTRHTSHPTSRQHGSPSQVRDSVKRDRLEITRNIEAEVIDLVDEDEEPEVASNERGESAEMECSPSSGRGDRINSSEVDDDKPPPFNLVALCKDGESIREMKARVGEEFVMDKVTEAQEAGREIVGGEELGLTGSYNKSVFECFSKTVVADQLDKKRASKSVTEKALRGEYKFHYRGRPKDSTSDKRQGSWRGNRSRGRLAKYRRRRTTA